MDRHIAVGDTRCQVVLGWALKEDSAVRDLDGLVLDRWALVRAEIGLMIDLMIALHHCYNVSTLSHIDLWQTIVLKTFIYFGS